MGLFSGKTKVYVASSLWNMAGDPSKRPKMLPSLVLSAAMSGSKEGIGSQLVKTLRSSSALRSQSFYNWARNSYDLGMPTGRLNGTRSVNAIDISGPIRNRLSLGSNQLLRIHAAYIDSPDVDYWVDHWVRENRPAWSEDDWVAEYDVTAGKILITKDAENHLIDPDPDYLWGISDRNRRLLYVLYQVLTENEDEFWGESEMRLHTYRMGSGNAVLDTLMPTGTDLAEFFPVLPLRIHNESIRDGDPELYANVKTGFKRMTGGKLDDILDDLEEHESIDDMDHVFAVPGVSLNSENEAAQAYIYEFFKNLQNYQSSSYTRTEYMQQQAQNALAEVEWNRWTNANSSLRGRKNNPRYKAPPPQEGKVYMTLPYTNGLRITMADLPEFSFGITWGSIQETSHAGNCKRFDGDTSRPLAKKGDYWFHVLEPTSFDHITVGNENNSVGRNLTRLYGNSNIAFFHQYAKRRYRMITVRGLLHNNLVYGDKSITIQAGEALVDEEESGFLLPLHMPTLRRLPALHKADLATGSLYVVVNSYKKVKQKWYQTGFFKILTFAVTIALSVFAPGLGLGAGSGLLGANTAVGIGLGASAMTAALVGAIANGLASVIITTLISRLSVVVLGEKWGALIGTLATFVGMQVGAQFAATGSFNVDWGAMFRADNLINLTNAIGNAYARFIAGDTMEIYQEMMDAREQYGTALSEIESKYEEILGVTNISFDPMILMDAAEQFGESSEAFLGRTLLTGSDIAQMSNSLITNFTDLSLELPRAP